jgi:hypothetical protein
VSADFFSREVKKFPGAGQEPYFMLKKLQKGYYFLKKVSEHTLFGQLWTARGAQEHLYPLPGPLLEAHD